MGDQKSNNNLLSRYRGALMGISILVIILFHFTEDCQIYEYHYSGWIRWFRIHIGSSSVDAFLFFSGLGLYYAMKKNPDIGVFYRRRFARLLIPYVIVALPSWIILDEILEKRGMWEACKDFTFLSFFSDGDRWYWYIGLMLFCYLIYPYVFQIVDCATDAIDGEMRLLSLVSAITVLALVIELFEKETFSNTNIALLRLPIFLAGCFYGRSSYEGRTSYWKWGVLFVISAGLLMLLPTDSPIFGRYVSGIFNVSVCAGIAWIFSKVSYKQLLRVLEWFGGRSLELYLTHVTIRKFMKHGGYPTCYIRYELVMIGCSLAAAWLLHMLVQKLMKSIAIG
ncbi:MAG: acyltransferase [Lachnospiraceae bacterium]|nr:acyltransferase [Lachnospiraceae bacterium]